MTPELKEYWFKRQDKRGNTLWLEISHTTDTLSYKIDMYDSVGNKVKRKFAQGFFDQNSLTPEEGILQTRYLMMEEDLAEITRAIEIKRNKTLGVTPKMLDEGVFCKIYNTPIIDNKFMEDLMKRVKRDGFEQEHPVKFTDRHLPRGRATPKITAQAILDEADITKKTGNITVPSTLQGPNVKETAKDLLALATTLYSGRTVMSTEEHVAFLIRDLKKGITAKSGPEADTGVVDEAVKNINAALDRLFPETAKGRSAAAR